MGERALVIWHPVYGCHLSLKKLSIFSRVYSVPIAQEQQPPEKQSAQQYPVKKIQ